MAGVIGVQTAAAGSSTSAALSLRARSAAASPSSRCLAGNPSTSVRRLCFMGSKDLRRDDLVRLRSGKRRNHKTNSASRVAFQVRSSAEATAVKWITDFFVKHPVHYDTANTVLYKGVATIAKKRAALTNLVQVDLIDANAAVEDNLAEILKQRIEIQLVSNDLDPKTNNLKVSDQSDVENWVLNPFDADNVADDDCYPITFTVPKDFGEPGAFIIKNHHPNEFYIKSLVLQDTDKNTIEFSTNAWIYNTKKYPKDRAFFTNKVYLPDATPPGLKALREQELEQTRGNGTGERQPADRIYDYDVYNDLGNPDKSPQLGRPVLGGSQEYPYPRRTRTGRPMTKADPKSESPVKGQITSLAYIPSDEFFLRSKNSTFVAGFIQGTIQGLSEGIAAQKDSGSFESFQSVKNLYVSGVDDVKVSHGVVDKKFNKTSRKAEGSDRGALVFLNQIFTPKGSDNTLLHFAEPQVIATNDKAWTKDEEFGHQALAGLNPNVIRLMESYPPKSALDPAEWGEGTALTEEHILPYLEGKSVAEAIKNKKLFIIDYHDPIMQLINAVNADTATGFLSYATRTIFHYDSNGYLKPIAIELSLPPTQKGGAASNRVFTPADAADHLWELAKCHAACMDTNYHEVVSHFTFTHACVEPYIIATHRHLSPMHPIFVLLKPYYKDTLSINSAARAVLIGAAGNIELNFTMGKNAMVVGALAYKALWRFDQQGLPQELVARGMAVPADSSHPGSVELVIDDYPYAKDGLDLWDAIHKFVTKYVEIVYKGSDEAIKSDTELQAWWNEIVNVGHADYKDASWWPKLDSIKNLAQIISTIAWTAGPNHAAVNFGQYAYGGFPLNKTNGTRKLLPEKESADYKELQSNPDKFLLDTILDFSKTLHSLTILELLATHSIDEEYIGTRDDPNWTLDAEVKVAFSEFSEKIKAIEETIAKRNADNNSPNRHGPAGVPYTLLSPSSSPGLTGRGVPNSISI